MDGVVKEIWDFIKPFLEKETTTWGGWTNLLVLLLIVFVVFSTTVAHVFLAILAKLLGDCKAWRHIEPVSPVAAALTLGGVFIGSMLTIWFTGL
jgi:hypothetical protein